MLDGLSLDLIRTFIAAADEGSFSAAGRRIGRTQSVVSQSIANIEGQLRISLFERTGRYPILTEEGKSLLDHARRIVREVDAMKALAQEFSSGLESELSVVFDVLFPQGRLTEAVAEFARKFPKTALRLHVEALGAVVQLVLDRQCGVGVAGSLPVIPAELERDHLMDVPMVTVVAPGSPLATRSKPISRSDLAQQTQLVLTDRSTLTNGRDYGVVSEQTWRLADLGSKHAFLLAGLGWGHMPLPLVANDIKAGFLVRILLEDFPSENTVIPMMAVYRSDRRPGIAGRWLIDRLRDHVAK